MPVTLEVADGSTGCQDANVPVVIAEARVVGTLEVDTAAQDVDIAVDVDIDVVDKVLKVLDKDEPTHDQ